MCTTNVTARTSPTATTSQVRAGGHPGASVSAVHTSPTAPRTSSAPTPSMRQPGCRRPRVPAGKAGGVGSRQDHSTGHQRGDHRRHIDQEDPAPARRLDQQAAQQRAAARGERANARPHPDRRRRSLTCREHRQRQPQRRRHQHRRPGRLQRPERDKRRQARGHRAAQRGDAEHHQARRENVRRPATSAARPAGSSSAASTMA